MIVRLTLLVLALSLFIGLVFASLNLGETVSAQSGSPTASPEIILQTGHSKAVKAIVFGPENRWVATGAFDNTIRIWETGTGHELRTFAGHTGAIAALLRNREGTILASSGNDNSVRTWDVDSGKEIRKFNITSDSTPIVGLSDDGQLVAFSGSDNSVELRNTSTGSLVWASGGHKAQLMSIAFAPDGRTLITAYLDGSIRSWAIQTGKEGRALKGHTKAVTSLRFDREGQAWISADDGGTVRLWKISTGGELPKFSTASGRWLDLNYSKPNGLIMVEKDRTIWTHQGTPGAKANKVARCVDPNGETDAAAFSADGRLVAFGNGDGTTSICDAMTGESTITLENHIVGSYDVAVSADQRFLASAGFDNTVKLWDLQTGQNLPPFKGHTGRITAVAFRPGTNLVISGSVDTSIRVWDAITRQPPIVLAGHTDTVQSLAVSRSGNILASSSSDQTIGIWDLTTSSAQPRFLKQHLGEVTSVDISHDEQRLVSGGADQVLRVWNIKTGSVITSFDTGSKINSVAFSPDGQRIVSGGADSKIKVWNAGDGKLLSTLSGHSGAIYSLSFSADSRRIASASLDKSARVWNVAEGRELTVLKAHDGIVYSAVFSPDQRFILTSSDDGSLIFWPAEKAVPLARLITLKQGHEWLVVTGNGFFDGSSGSWERLSWRFDNATFRVSPIEIFFNEFFKPGLLAETLERGSQPPGAGIISKNRLQPIVRLFAAEPDDTTPTGTIKVRIDAVDAGAGVRDVRLFRNGLLVKAWRGGAEGHTIGPLEATVPIVAGDNVLTAYAFNSDNIKSRDARLTVNGNASLARRGVLHILTVGVNEYANADFNLRYAVADARDIGSEVKKRQTEINFFERVEEIELSDGKATKHAILTALRDLATRLKPQDGLLIYFAGHGVAHQDRFYLIPHDLGYAGRRDDLGRSGLQEIYRNSISDQELEKVLETIDAGQIMLVIDACNSGQVLESEEKRQGPMNSKGLAQLAYEKGMYILTAAQSYQAAKEASKLGHGFLTFALVEEGLRKNGADRDPRDGQILLTEWLDFALARVPQINEEAVTERKLEREKDKTLKTLGRNDLQRPRAFYRRGAELRPFIVSKSKMTGN